MQCVLTWSFHRIRVCAGVRGDGESTEWLVEFAVMVDMTQVDLSSLVDEAKRAMPAKRDEAVERAARMGP